MMSLLSHLTAHPSLPPASRSSFWGSRACRSKGWFRGRPLDLAGTDSTAAVGRGRPTTSCLRRCHLGGASSRGPRVGRWWRRGSPAWMPGSNRRGTSRCPPQNISRSTCGFQRDTAVSQLPMRCCSCSRLRDPDRPSCWSPDWANSWRGPREVDSSWWVCTYRTKARRNLPW